MCHEMKLKEKFHEKIKSMTLGPIKPEILPQEQKNKRIYVHNELMRINGNLGLRNNN